MTDRRHQTVVVRLWKTLDAAKPPALKVLVAPLDVVLANDTVVQPDLLVARREQFSARDLPGTPLLAVEVMSPSTRHVDLALKRARFEAAGCPSYWVVDPDAPSLTAWNLRDGEYVEVAHVEGTDEFEADEPYAVTVVPARLLD